MKHHLLPALGLLWLSATGCGAGEKLATVTLKDGTVLEQVEIGDITPKGIRVTHKSGGGLIPAANLPPSLEDKYKPQLKEARKKADAAEEAEYLRAKAIRKAAADKAAATLSEVAGLGRVSSAVVKQRMGNPDRMGGSALDYEYPHLSKVNTVTVHTRLDQVTMVAVSGPGCDLTEMLTQLGFDAATMKERAPVSKNVKRFTAASSTGVRWDIKATMSPDVEMYADQLVLTPLP